METIKQKNKKKLKKTNLFVHNRQITNIKNTLLVIVALVVSAFGAGCMSGDQRTLIKNSEAAIDRYDEISEILSPATKANPKK